MSDVVIIGAGVVGACTALALLADGHRVTIIEPRAPGGDHAASYGNGGWLSTASVVPMSLPGLWKNIPRYLLDSDGRWSFARARCRGLRPGSSDFWRLGKVTSGSPVLRAPCRRFFTTHRPAMQRSRERRASLTWLLSRD